MLTLWGDRPAGSCDGLPRRDFLRAGVLGLGGVGGSELGLGDVLRARAATVGTPGESRPKSVILYWLDGGPSHLETYDPKPFAPAEFRGPFQAIDTDVPGIQVNELLTGHAKIMRHCSVLRSVHHNHGDHFAAAHWMLTGYLGSNAQNLDPQFPAAGAIVAKLRGANRPGVPPYVAVPHSMTVGLRPGYNSGAYLGVAYDPFNSEGDPNDPNFRVPNLDLAGGLTTARLDDRRGLLSDLDRLRREVDRRRVMDGVDTFNQRAFELVTGEAARTAFDIQQEDPALRDRYGRDHYGQSALLARRLVESGVTFVTVHNGGWDHHWDCVSGMNGRLPTMDRAISTLIADLAERNLLDDVLVVVMGEFSRSPRMNDGGNGGPPLSKGTPGRDHWGNVMSVLLAGGGLRGGQVVGASSPKGEYPAERPLMPADVLATIYHVLGIDLGQHFVNRSGRPVPINNGGQVIRELV